MLRNEDIDLVRSSATMRAVAEAYGCHVDRKGFAPCPFHQDTNPSMKIYDGDRGYYCFVCHAGGDIFDFVMRHDSVNFGDAVRKVAGMFGVTILGGTSITDDDIVRHEAMKAKKEAALRQRKSAEKRLNKIASDLTYYRDVQTRFEPLSDVWCWIQDKIEHLDYRWNELFDELSRKTG